MIKHSIYVLAILSILSFGCFAGSSANFSISAEVIDLGGASMESANHQMVGKLRELEPEMTTSANQSIEGRFLGMSLGTSISTFEIPAITSIAPNNSLNNLLSLLVTIEGHNISSDAVARLAKSGQTDILGGTVTVDASGTSMECLLGLLGVAPGTWNVLVSNVGFGATGVLGGGFTITSPGRVHIIGIPFNDPNPFNPDNGPTHIKYKLSAPATIAVYMFNQKGELIWQRTFSANEEGGKGGDNDISWDGITDFKENVPTGVYVLRIISKSGGVRELGLIKIAILRQ